MTNQLLIVDDEQTTRLALAEAFRQSGYRVDLASSGEMALDMITAVSYDVVLLDIQMPGIKGDEVLTISDKIAPDTAFIVLTAHASTDTAITALRSGAVDYLRKPSSLNTILTAVDKAILKQEERKQQKDAAKVLQQIRDTLQVASVPVHSTSGSMSAEPILQAGDIVIHEQSQTASFKHHSLDLTPIEYRLLCTLVSQPNTVFSYADLARASHDSHLDEMEARALLRTHVYRLSRKLGDKENSPVQSVRGRGVILQQ